MDAKTDGKSERYGHTEWHRQTEKDIQRNRYIESQRKRVNKHIY